MISSQTQRCGDPSEGRRPQEMLEFLLQESKMVHFSLPQPFKELFVEEKEGTRQLLGKSITFICTENYRKLELEHEITFGGSDFHKVFQLSSFTSGKDCSRYIFSSNVGDGKLIATMWKRRMHLQDGAAPIAESEMQSCQDSAQIRV